jgi:Predicted membrane protein (DUF2177)
MTYIIAYVAVLIVFGTIDAVWLTTMGALLYRPALGDILTQNLRVVPVIAFYLIFPVGIVVFAVLPGLRAIAACRGGARLAVRCARLRDLRPDQLRDAAQLDAADHRRRYRLRRARLRHRCYGGLFRGAADRALSFRTDTVSRAQRSTQ